MVVRAVIGRDVPAGLMTPLALVGLAGAVLSLALVSGVPHPVDQLWSPLAGGFVLVVALRAIGLPGIAALVAGLAWSVWPGRLAAADADGVRLSFLLPLSLVALHRMLAGRRSRHLVECGAITALQATLAGPGAAAMLGGVLGAALALSAAIGRWRSRMMLRLVGGTTLLAATLLWGAAMIGVFDGGRAIPPVDARAGWRVVATALATVPDGNRVYGQTGVLPVGPTAAFPGLVVMTLAAMGWWRARAVERRPVAASAAGLSAGGLVAMAVVVPPEGVLAASVVVMLGLSVLAGLGAASWPALMTPRVAILLVIALACLLWLEAWRVPGVDAHARTPETTAGRGTLGEVG